MTNSLKDLSHVETVVLNVLPILYCSSMASGNNPAIISKEVFKAVQIKTAQRSNVTEGVDGKMCKNKKYSTKNK